jgi:hypothetical protein
MRQARLSTVGRLALITMAPASRSGASSVSRTASCPPFIAKRKHPARIGLALGHEPVDDRAHEGDIVDPGGARAVAGCAAAIVEMSLEAVGVHDQRVIGSRDALDRVTDDAAHVGAVALRRMQHEQDG